MNGSCPYVKVYLLALTLTFRPTCLLLKVKEWIGKDCTAALKGLLFYSQDGFHNGAENAMPTCTGETRANTPRVAAECWLDLAVGS